MVNFCSYVSFTGLISYCSYTYTDFQFLFKIKIKKLKLIERNLKFKNTKKYLIESITYKSCI